MKKVILPLLAGIVLVLFPSAPVQAAEPGVLAIRNARIFPVGGPVLPRGTVIVRNGLIEAIGESISPPADAWIIEGEGLTVYPGLISALSTWGIPQAAPPPPPIPGRLATPAAPQAPPARSPEERPQTFSWVHAADDIQTTETRLSAARDAGFTTAITYPERGLIAGHAAAINLAGQTARDMVLVPSAGLYLSTSTTGGFRSFPGSLMGVLAYFRQVYLDAGHYQLVKADYEKSPAGKKRPQYDRALDGVLEAHRVLLPAARAVEIDRMLRFAAELKLSPILYGGTEAYKSADLLKKAGVPILVNVTWPQRSPEMDPEADEILQILDVREKAPTSPAVLAAAGVPFAFYATGKTTPRDFIKNVKKAIDAGLKPEDGLRALTLGAARIYGIADRTGSIEKGKIANLLVTKGDLFSESAKVQFVLIDGRKYEPAPEPVTPEGGSAR